MVTTVGFNFQVLHGLATEWASAVFSADTGNAKYMPANVLLHESDTGKFKVSNGLTGSYADLPYIVDAVFTGDFKAILDTAGTAGGALKLGGDGRIGSSYIPASIVMAPLVVATYADMVAVPVAERGRVFIVRDARDGDATVASARPVAFYIYDDANATFVKIGEQESMDYDFSDFVMAGDTMSRLTDGTTYVRFLKTERDLMVSLASNLSALSTLEEGNRSAMAARFDAIDGRQTTVDTSLSADEATLSYLTTNVMRKSVSYDMLSVDASDL